jgi:hypothetical protein
MLLVEPDSEIGPVGRSTHVPRYPTLEGNSFVGLDVRRHGGIVLAERAHGQRGPAHRQRRSQRLSESRRPNVQVRLWRTEAVSQRRTRRRELVCLGTRSSRGLDGREAALVRIQPGTVSRWRRDAGPAKTRGCARRTSRPGCRGGPSEQSPNIRFATAGRPPVRAHEKYPAIRLFVTASARFLTSQDCLLIRWPQVRILPGAWEKSCKMHFCYWLRARPSQV